MPMEEEGRILSFVTGVTLLSKKEYEGNFNLVELPPDDNWWWTRTVAYGTHVVCVVENVEGRICFADVGDGGICIRPALKCDLSAAGLKPRDKVVLKGQSYTVLRGNLLLKDESIGKDCFREDWEALDANVYETSDVKKYIEEWYKEEFGKDVKADELMVAEDLTNIC